MEREASRRETPGQTIEASGTPSDEGDSAQERYAMYVVQAREEIRQEVDARMAAHDRQKKLERTELLHRVLGFFVRRAS
jgi:hypothetical protein